MGRASITPPVGVHSLARPTESAPLFGSPSRIGLYVDPYWPQLRKAWIGTLLTTLALSLGAPFWFDILDKIVNVRAVGRNPAENAKVAAGQRPTS